MTTIMRHAIWRRASLVGCRASRRQPTPRCLTTAAAVTPSVTPDPAPHPALPANSTSNRRDALRDAKPFSDFLTDNFSRQHDYLRISVTERCNLRCVYCMPEEGVPLSPSRDILTTPEIVMLSSVFVNQGVTKIRLTGGEPTVRRDIVPLMRQLGALRPHGLKELCLTTNGLSLHRKLDAMVEAGLTGINLSLDTLDPWQFQIMTRRNGFAAVRKTIDRIFELNRAGAGLKFKINCVVMRGRNDAEIVPFVDMTRDRDVEVRFIEYMPFDGNRWNEGKMLGYAEMLDVIRAAHPTVEKVRDHRNDTAKTWRVPGFAGRVGFITSMTHNFCGSCNRLRVTSDGNLKVCLFGNAEVSLRDILRKSNAGEPIDEQAYEAMKQIEMDRRQGLATSDQPLGTALNEAELLDIIGMAVKRKKEKHAGMENLQHMKNRPMILIEQDGHPAKKLTHVSASGTAHMVSISSKTPTSRVAKAACTVTFTTPEPLRLIAENQVKKGDVLGVARVAGIMAAKRTPDLIPLCHPIPISHVSVELRPREAEGGSRRGCAAIDVEATVTCDGKTGVEMEALTAASTAALTVYDMCKAVDKGMVISDLRVVLKDGGKSGRWEMP
ncbi:molybdenum cofactor biosynthesis protein 1 B [Verticillium dahliae VdLs.17]|uniref:Molybdenum cofactor biosynthesis protein 1 B n=1 Tax=Verticillium dahliae (strain VdLs.17 / ATCC MYA-4575 / FGSC 10137) TaxID=498257 RepID=G2X6J4_VERDV|nr:molybdenum cofactor biosynthesis protein 1 B [Verticillium dahliae VdLs.17]EGY14612.1 molybdenum cofactor biosynthesis protein 1 B [Verticillium dahliae VdLs.17]